MAKLTKDEFISSLKEMNLLEIKELVDAMKEEFGVDPSAVAVAAPAGAGVADAAPSTVTVTIADAGASKVAVIKVVKEITGLGLKESKDIVDANGVVKENISVAEADEIKANLVAQADNPVKWIDCVNTMKEFGADTFVEAGPGKTLCGFNRRIDRSLKSVNVENLETLQKTLDYFKEVR